MNINEYIESGIIERYLLGLASNEEASELFALHKVYPILDVEFAAAELRIEDKCIKEAEYPPLALRETILNRFKTDDNDNTYTEQHYKRRSYSQQVPPTGTYILEPFWKRRMTVSAWWRCVVIAMAVAMMALAASTWYFYQQSSQLQDVLFKIKTPSSH